MLLQQMRFRPFIAGSLRAISLPRRRSEKALPAVIQQVADCGYAVDHADTVEAFGEHGFLRKYRLEPGGGSIQFMQNGDKFGMRSVKLPGEGG